MTDNLQHRGGVNWRVKKQSHILISKAPWALFRKKYGISLKQNELLTSTWARFKE